MDKLNAQRDFKKDEHWNVSQAHDLSVTRLRTSRFRSSFSGFLCPTDKLFGPVQKVVIAGRRGNTIRIKNRMPPDAKVSTV